MMSSAEPPSRMDEALETSWRQWSEQGLQRTLRQAWNRSGAEIVTHTGAVVDFSSNDSLGLASDARLARAAISALSADATGAGASRLIAGNHPQHEQLEADLATFFHAAAATFFASGYAANTGVLPSLVGQGDVIFADELNHASLIDGCRLASASTLVYPHANVGALRELLHANRARYRHAIIATDGLFSMEGAHAPLNALIDLAREFDAWTYVDDAHAVGVAGATGRGTGEECGVHGQIDVTIGTLGKAFGVAGAFAYGSAALRRHLVNHARTFVFSTGTMPAQCAAIRESLRIVGREPQRLERLRTNVGRLRTRLREAGIRALGSDRSHIVPLVIGRADRTVRVGKALRDAGFLVGAVRPPTVPDGTSRLRIGVSAAHTPAQIDGLVSAIGTAMHTE